MASWDSHIPDSIKPELVVGHCPYFLRGWMAMLKQGNLGFSYRFRFNPKSGGIDAMPVPHPNAYRESIVEEEQLNTQRHFLEL